MATIEKKARGKYAVRWRDPNGRQRQHTVRTSASAKAIERLAAEAEDLGEFYDPRAARGEPRLRVVVEEFIAEEKRHLKANTWKHRKYVIDRWVDWAEARSRTSRVGPSDIDRAMLNDWWDYCSESCSTNTSNSRLRMVYGVVEWLRDHERHGDWMGRIPRPKVRDEPPAGYFHAPTWSQMDLAIEAGLSGSAPWYGRLMTVLRCTGLRPGQVMRLRWDDVDAVGRTLLVRPRARQEPDGAPRASGAPGPGPGRRAGDLGRPGRMAHRPDALRQDA